ncbi:MAG: chalcone isomerase family protein [Burkholderiales bacterium]|nr:chalcone isomerase family protein [Burkholderiales bacterium]
MKTPSAIELCCVLVLTVCGLGMAQSVAAAEVAGVHYQATSQTGSTRLLLNGAGIRQLASVGLYTVGLYTEKKLASANEVLNTTGATQLRMVMLRETSAKKLADMLTQGLVNNATDEGLAPLVSEIFEVGMMLSEHANLLAGDTIQVDSHPLTGTTITIQGNAGSKPVSQTFANPHVFKAMMGIWLGSSPVDPALKSALLGASI